MPISLADTTVAIVGIQVSNAGTATQELAQIGSPDYASAGPLFRTMFLEVAAVNAGGGSNFSVSLWDFSANAVVAGSTITGTTTTPYGVYRSGSFSSSNIIAGHIFGIQFTNANITIARVVGIRMTP